MKIKKMETNHVDSVRELDSKAFSLSADKKRKRSNIISCRNLNPSGCFVAEKEEIVGYIFSRKWGKIGWIGTFGVHPEHQGKGIGKKLLEKAKQNLMKDCSLIGLSTPATKKNNIGMYISQGFGISSPTFLLKKDLDIHPALEKKQKTFLVKKSLKEIDKEFLSKVSRLSESCKDGLDYKSEVKRALNDDWDEVLCNEKEFLDWFSIVRTSSKLENEIERDGLKIRNLLSKTNDTKKLIKIIKSIERFALDKGFKKVLVPVNQNHSELLKFLVQKSDYKLHKLYMRLIMKGSYKELEGVDLSIWIM